ncbi:MAG: two-component system chemotaxis response regulator CheB [Granulosicoccus sp.]|jgi:two-component system chemotaxis response regulator CheB
MNKKRILIVEDSVAHRMLISTVIDGHPMLEVVGTAENGLIALKMIQELNPDLVTLDIQMPVMDGLETLREMRVRCPDLPSVMISSLTGMGADAALDALALGARDCIEKPAMSGGWEASLKIFRNDIHAKILALCGVGDLPRQLQRPAIRTPQTSSSHAKKKPTTSARSRSKTSAINILAIGISTGGPDALTRLIPELPADLPLPVVIAQHMPPGFTQKLAIRLDSLSAVNVKEAQAGDVLTPGTVYIAPGDYHMVLKSRGEQIVIALNQDPLENSCRPAVDKLFRSVSTIFGSECLAVIMTGMGRDGLLGAESLSAAGALILVQDEASSVVWGMPGFVARAGLADEIVALDKMANAILSRLTKSTSTRVDIEPLRKSS